MMRMRKKKKERKRQTKRKILPESEKIATRKAGEKLRIWIAHESNTKRYKEKILLPRVLLIVHEETEEETTNKTEKKKKLNKWRR